MFREWLITARAHTQTHTHTHTTHTHVFHFFFFIICTYSPLPTHIIWLSQLYVQRFFVFFFNETMCDEEIFAWTAVTDRTSPGNEVRTWTRTKRRPNTAVTKMRISTHLFHPLFFFFFLSPDGFSFSRLCSYNILFIRAEIRQ